MVQCSPWSLRIWELEHVQDFLPPSVKSKLKEEGPRGLQVFPTRPTYPMRGAQSLQPSLDLPLKSGKTRWLPLNRSPLLEVPSREMAWTPCPIRCRVTALYFSKGALPSTKSFGIWVIERFNCSALQLLKPLKPWGKRAPFVGLI